jgi:HK97 family phage major capsid protein
MDARWNELRDIILDEQIKRDRLHKEAKELHTRANDRALTEGEQQRWDRLTAGADAAHKRMEEAREEMAGLATQQIARGAFESGDGATGAPQMFGGGQLFGRARRLIDAAARSGQLPDHAAQKVTSLVEQGPDRDRSLAARWTLAAGDDHYRSAFAKLLADPARGHLLWTGQEGEAYRTAAKVQAEMRAMSLTDTAGGFMVPLTLDPAILLSSDGSINPLRRISRVVQTVTDQWQGVSSAGATAEWKAEAAEMADASPTLGDEPIPVHFGDAFVPYSFEVGMDAVNFTSELSRVLVDAADQLMNTAYTTGTGSGQPTGVVTALAGSASEINGTGTEALDDSDPYALQNALPARFSPRAVFLSHIATANGYRAMETTNGAQAFPELRQNPPMLLGKPWYENSNMDGATNPAVTANNYVLLYGDFQHFVIVDRIGTTLEIMPHVVGTNRRPTGQRGAILWFRTGSNVVVPNAFRMLDVPTTA